MSTAALLGGVVLAVGGAAASVWGWRRDTRHQLIDDTPTTDVRNITEPGIVELSGEVVPAPDAGDEPFTAPFSGTKNCVVAGWEVEDWDERGDYSNWRTEGDGIRAVPFYLDDGTDRVLVDPGRRHSDGTAGFLETLGDLGDFSASISVGDVVADFERFPVVAEVGVDEEPPDRIARFVAGERAVGRQTGSITNLVDIGNAHGDRRFSQGTIRAGDEVYLLGYAQPRDGDERARAADDPVSVRLRPDTAVVTPPPEGEDGAFIVSERDERRLLSESRWGRAVLVAGLFAVVAGLALVVSPTTLLA